MRYKIRRYIEIGTTVAFIVEMILVAVCQLCFIVGFIFGKNSEFPFLLSIASDCLPVLMAFAVLFIVALPAGLVVRVKISNMIMIVVAIIAPLISIIETVVWSVVTRF